MVERQAPEAMATAVTATWVMVEEMAAWIAGAALEAVAMAFREADTGTHLNFAPASLGCERGRKSGEEEEDHALNWNWNWKGKDVGLLTDMVQCSAVHKSIRFR